MSMNLRRQAVERFEIDQALQKFRFTAAKKQAEFFKITKGRSPRVTKESIDEEAQRLYAKWKSRLRPKALPPANVPEEILTPKFSESPKNARGNFECPRCYRVFRDQERYAKHTAGHYSANVISVISIRMAEVEAGRGLERSSRKLSEAEREDLRYFLNDNY